MQRQYIGSLGFSPQWNGQDYIRFDAHGIRSHYVPDGPYIAFGNGTVWNIEGVDEAEDLSVIVHEYGHALHDAFMVGTDTFAPPYYDELWVSEGICDYLAISYRRTLSSFQPDNVFPWYQNITDIPLTDMIRKLESSFCYPTKWVTQYEAGTTWASTMMDIQNAGVSRDIIIKLFLTSCSFVSPTSMVHDNIYAILQADIDLYSGAHISTIVNAFYNRGFFNNQLSGTITSNTTWSGNILIMGDITVTNGATLTINPKTQVKFYNGSSIIINNYATLNANGTSSQPITFNFTSSNSTTENGIKFIATTSMGTINYCQIRNAYRGVYEYQTAVNITNTAISGCYNGIYLSGSSPTIQYCNIHDNTNAGIYLINYSSPNLYNNYMTNNYYGVYCTTNSSPKFGSGSTQGKNRLNNYCGVYCWNNSLPVLGKSSPLDGGYNNLVNASQNIYNASSGTVYAHHTWWGTSNPANFLISGSGTTSYKDSLSSSVTISPAPPLSKAVGESYASEKDEIPMLSELDKAYELVASNNLNEARAVCMNLINNYPDYSVSYNALNLLKETYTDRETTSKSNIYKTLFSEKGNKDLYAMAGLILSGIDKENKLKHIDEVIEKYKGESVVELALFDKFVHYYFDMEDEKSARAISDELDTQFPKSIGAIEAHKILGDEEYLKLNWELQPDAETAKQVTDENKFVMDDNYPNPFNPTTTISYSLPEAGNVQIKVYDVLGREVAKLVDETKSAGKHTVTWNGSNNASGIYFYTITFNNQTLYKKMLMIK